KLADDQPLDIGPHRFIVFRIGAVISDFRVGENYNLSRVGRISEDFLVAGNRSIKNDFPVAFAFSAVAFAAEDAPIFQRKDCLHSCSREWILSILTRKQKSTKHCLREVLEKTKDRVARTLLSAALSAVRYRSLPTLSTGQYPNTAFP